MLVEQGHTRQEPAVKKYERFQALHREKHTREVFQGQGCVLPLHPTRGHQRVHLADHELIEEQVMSLAQLRDEKTRFKRRHKWIKCDLFLVTCLLVYVLEGRLVCKTRDQTYIKGNSSRLYCLRARFNELDGWVVLKLNSDLIL